MSRLKSIKWNLYLNYIVVAAVTVLFAILSLTGNLSASYAYLFEKSDYHMLCTLDGISLIPSFRLFELRYKISGALDGARNKLREEGYEERIEEEILLGFYVASVNVYNVRESLEGIE